MDSKDLFKLAKLFDSFIELDSSRVRAVDIVAVRKADAGIEVVTPHGVFPDSTDYDTFNTRIKDTLELLKERVVEEEKIVSTLGSLAPIPPALGSSVPAVELEQLEQSERKIVPLDTNPGVQTLETTITVGPQGAQGILFSDSTIELTDKQNILILDPTKQTILARPGDGSSMKGDGVSGFIYTSGKYMLSFVDYPHKSAVVSYSVKKKAVAQ
jgi:c-di-AMP phosphodiesterase-like protein